MSLPSTAANKPVVLGKVGICLLNIVSYFAVLAFYQSSLGPGFVVGKRVKVRRAKQTEWWIGEGKRAVEPSPDYHSASPLRFFFITSPTPPTAESVPGYTKVTYSFAPRLALNTLGTRDFLCFTFSSFIKSL